MHLGSFLLPTHSPSYSHPHLKQWNELIINLFFIYTLYLQEWSQNNVLKICANEIMFYSDTLALRSSKHVVLRGKCKILDIQPWNVWDLVAIGSSFWFPHSACCANTGLLLVQYPVLDHSSGLSCEFFHSLDVWGVGEKAFDWLTLLSRLAPNSQTILWLQFLSIPLLQMPGAEAWTYMLSTILVS